MNPEAPFYFPISFKVIRHLTWTDLLCSLLVDGSPLSTAACPKFVIPYLQLYFLLCPTWSASFLWLWRKARCLLLHLPWNPQAVLESGHLPTSFPQPACELCGLPAAAAGSLLPLHVWLPDGAEGSVLFTTLSSLPGRRPSRILQSAQGLFSTHAPCFQPMNVFKSSENMSFSGFPFLCFLFRYIIKVSEVTGAHTFLYLVLWKCSPLFCRSYS